MRIQQRLTYANIVSTLCLVLLLIGGGAAYALGKNTVGSPQIIDKSIKAKDLGKGSVATSKIKKGAVANGKIRNGAVTGAKVKDGSLSGNDLAPRAQGALQAAAEVAQDGGVVKQYNRLGNAVAVSRTGEGTYIVAIPGAASGAKIVGVTARDFDTYCQATNEGMTNIKVTCRFIGSSALLDSRFSIYLIQ